VTLAELALYRILLSETVGVTDTRVTEDEAGGIQYGNLIAVLEIATFVPPNVSSVDVGTISREVFQHSRRATVFVLVEKEAMSIAHSRNVDDAVCEDDEPGSTVMRREDLPHSGCLPMR